MAWNVNDELEYTANTQGRFANNNWFVHDKGDGFYEIGEMDPTAEDNDKSTMKISVALCEGCFKLVV